MTRRQLTLCLAGCAVSLLLLSCGSKKTARMGPGPAQYKVRLQTTKGDVVILVHRDGRPSARITSMS